MPVTDSKVWKAAYDNSNNKQVAATPMTRSDGCWFLHDDHGGSVVEGDGDDLLISG